MKIGIILAAGKGKRFKSKKTNKTAVEFKGKPLITYGLDLFSQVSDKVVVVVGAFSESVLNLIADEVKVVSVYQKKRLGTGHAVKVAVDKIEKEGWIVEKVYVGYGDHMMFYTPDILVKLDKELENRGAVLSMVTCEYNDPVKLAWGRIVRDMDGNVDAIIEQKDASEEELKIKELNAGLYCIRYDFLIKGLKKIKKSKVSGEYYLTDLIKVAKEMGEKVSAVAVPFKNVGIGINTLDELKKAGNYSAKVKTLKEFL